MKIAKKDKVLEQVIEDLNLDITTSQLASLVNVQAVNNTQVFKISVSNKDKVLAATIANHLLEVFTKEVNSLYNMNNIYTMDQAEVSNTPYNINHTKDLAVFVMIGLVLSFGLVVVIYLLDNTIKSEKDVEDYASLSVLSSIPMYMNKSGKQESELIVNEQPKSPISECFKTFRTNVMFSIQNKKLNTILVTSGFMGEGKSFVSSNLAVAFASSGKKVILVDTDMRKGRTYKIFKLSNKNGLSNCLAKIGTDGKNVNINEFIQETKISNLHIMTSGIVPPNPSELLSSSNMIQLLEALNRQYDVVICDGTPCMLVSDSIILSKIVDTTVIVTASKTTKLDTLLKMKKSIEMVGGNIGGVVINKMEIATKSYKNHYYYGEHDSIQNEAFVPSFEHDVTLDSPLFIKDLEQVIIKEPKLEKTSTKAITQENNSLEEINRLLDTIGENSKEIKELKGLYKDAIQNSLAMNSKEDSSNTILEELQNMKENYKNTTMAQKEQIELLSENIKQASSNSDVLEQFGLLKSSFEDMSTKYDKHIESAINEQNEQLNYLNKKLDSMQSLDLSSEFSDKLDELQDQYNDSIKTQNKQIDALSDKLDAMQTFDLSNEISDKLEELQDQYNDSINMQNAQIGVLNERLENLDSSDIILEKLNNMENMEKNYLNMIQMQNEKIEKLSNQVNTVPIKNELPNEVIQIYHQLESMNAKFESLEKRATNNEILIKNLSNEVKNSLYKPTRGLDIDKLNNKVIQIQDYLEKSVQTVANVPTSKSSRKNKSVLDGQMNIIDDLLENANISSKVEEARKQDTNKHSFVVDYESVKRRQERKVFPFFREKARVMVEDDEPIEIVSQILSNQNESVV